MFKQYFNSIKNYTNFYFIISTKSNCNCLLCNIKSFNNLSYNNIDKVFEYAKNLEFITITGGEPLLYPDICNYINEKRLKYNLKLNLITNGLFETSEEYTFVNSISPEIVTISYNKFHEPKKNLIENFIKNIDTLILEDVYDENYENDQEKNLKLQGVNKIIYHRFKSKSNTTNCKKCIILGLALLDDRIVPVCNKAFINNSCISSSKIEDYDKILNEIKCKSAYIDLYRLYFENKPHFQ
jgi:organic radical activating enzyme